MVKVKLTLNLKGPEIPGGCRACQQHAISASTEKFRISANEPSTRKFSLKKLIKKITKVIKKAFDTVKDAVQFIADQLAKIGKTLAEIVDEVTNIVEAALGKVLPDFVMKVVTVIISIIDFGAFVSAAFLQNWADAIKTGNLLAIFDVITPIVVGLIEKMRAEARSGSIETPGVVLMHIPDPQWRGQVQESLRFNYLKNLDTRFFWKIWGNFKGERTAICMIDTIVFIEETDFRQPDDVFEYLHEIKHFEQYRDLGTTDFVRKYLNEEAFKSGINKFEQDADLYACSLFPYGTPAYIGSCP